jgi:hypothetical protein
VVTIRQVLFNRVGDERPGDDVRVTGYSEATSTSCLPTIQTQPQFVGSTAFNETLTSERLAPPDS